MSVFILESVSSGDGQMVLRKLAKWTAGKWQVRLLAVTIYPNVDNSFPCAFVSIIAIACSCLCVRAIYAELIGQLVQAPVFVSVHCRVQCLVGVLAPDSVFHAAEYSRTAKMSHH